VTPVLLTVHGVLLLRGTGYSMVPWTLVGIAGASGVLGLALTSRVSPDLVVVAQALVLAVLAGWLITVTGGAQSFFLLWLFVIVSVYPATIPSPVRLPLVGAVALFYSTTPLFDDVEIPRAVLLSRALLLLGIGLIVIATASSRERLSVVDRRFRNLVESARDAILAMNASGRVVLTNRQAERLFAMPRTRLLASTLDDLIRSRSVTGDEAVDADNGPRLRWAQRGDGEETPVEITVTEGVGDDEVTATAIIRDVTDRHAAAQALRRREQDLEELVNSKNQLIASVSHEIRTPLTAIVGFARLLHDEADQLDEVERRTMLASIFKQSGELSDIVEDLLVAAKVDLGTLAVAREPVDLLAEANKVLEATTEAQGLTVDLRGPSVMAVGDAVRVRQIIRNLVSNAVRHGGPLVRIETGESREAAWLEVVDNGPGLPVGEEQRLFEPFELANEVPGLTATLGLGLSISSNLARLMEGDLVYDPAKGETRFRVTLPSFEGSEGRPGR
jgi:protein-histidine pros-kinase